MIKETIKQTGEIIELADATFTDVMKSWQIATDYEKAGKALKEKLKKAIPQYIGSNGRSEEIDGYQFRLSNVQKMTYDKAALREALGEDTYDLFMEPKKKAIDEYLAELVSKGDPDDITTKVRAAMLPKGKPYSQTVLEKLTREETV